MRKVLRVDNAPLRRPTRAINVPIDKQDPHEAVAHMNKQFRKWHIDSKPPTNDDNKSETSSMYNFPPSTIDALDICAGPSSTRPSTSMSSAISMSSRMSTAASIAESAIKLQYPKEEEVFCQMPIPGRGRGARRKQ